MRLVGKGGRNQPDEGSLVFKYQFFCRVFAFLGLVCLFTSMVSPYWIEIDGIHSTSYAGLWNICVTRKCQDFTVTSRLTSLLTMLLYSWSTKPNSTLGSPIPPTPYPISLFWAFYMGCFACFLFLLNGLLHMLIELQNLLEEQKNNMKLKEMGSPLLEEVHKEYVLSEYKTNIFA
ncbi:hypothetical protein JD844_005712 [Phrynosoma platyrhinos]|uniref:Uncharacterized protein n=1 Tax=Phrynosoma platyrhinos TaxID=52577 RepID=A0ABQ7TNX6_PHRPL|nr:hypothetical protein JD844_005712 [Phrynosoma platyrhinos]